MANNENLKRLTPSEAREFGRMGGIKSGEARRRRADFNKTLNTLLATEIDNEWKPILESLGLECTLESAMLLAQIKEAMAGNTKAAYFVAQYAGQSDKTDADLEEQRIRTDRAKRARDQEIGDTDSSDENIQGFLKAMRPTQEDLDNLFTEENIEEGDNNVEETEETG